MPQVGLKEAARLTGKNQSTIHRAMKSGKLSFKMNENGERMMDTAELDRVFSINPEGHNQSPGNDNEEMQRYLEEIAKLRLQLEAERASGIVSRERLGEKDDIIQDMKIDRDKWRNQAEKLLITDETPKKRGWFGLKKAS